MAAFLFFFLFDIKSTSEGLAETIGHLQVTTTCTVVSVRWNKWTFFAPAHFSQETFCDTSAPLAAFVFALQAFPLYELIHIIQACLGILNPSLSRAAKL